MSTTLCAECGTRHPNNLRSNNRVMCPACAMAGGLIIVKNPFTALEAIMACKRVGYSLPEGDGEVFTCDTSWGWSVDHVLDVAESRNSKEPSRPRGV